MSELTLGQKQRLLGKCMGKLLPFIYEDGCEVAFAWAYRPPSIAERLGMRRSLHTVKLAVDLDLFRDGVYLTQTSDHERYGFFWESLHPLCTWGGRWGDGNHYSITHEGRK